jgi:hypothetical protein
MKKTKGTTFTLSDLKRVARKLDPNIEVTQDIIGDSYCVEVISPPGFMFSCGDLHILVDHTYRPWKPDYADLIERLGYGLEECTDPECEWCHPDEE